MPRFRPAVTALVASVTVVLLATTGVLATASTASAQPLTSTTTSKSTVQSVTVVHFSRHSKLGGLNAAAVALPAGYKARGVITGPRKYRSVVALGSGQVVKKVKPGTYVLTASPLVVAAGAGRIAGTYTPTPARIVFKVTKRKTAVVRANYKNVVARAVVVAAAGAFTSPVTPPQDTTSPYDLILRAQYPVGAIVAAGIGPDTPFGLLAKVVSVGDSANGATDYTVVNATLQDAIPRGDLSKTIATTVTLNGNTPTGTLSAKSAVTSTTSAAQSTAQGATPALATVPFLKNVECTRSAHAKLSASIVGAINTTFSANWDIFNSNNNNVTMTSTTSLTGELSAEISGSASCELDKQELLAVPIELGTIEFLVGPVPVVINNSLNFTIQGSAEVGAKLAENVKSVLSMTTSATINGAGLTPSSTGPTLTNTFVPPTLSASGSAVFYLGARVNMLFYNLAGPFVEAELGPKIDVDSTEDPWWALSLELKVGAGLRANFFGIEPIEDDHIFTHSFPILDSKTAGDLSPYIGPDAPLDPGQPAPLPDPTPPADPGAGGVLPVPSDPDAAPTALQLCLDDALGLSASDPITPEQMLSLTKLDCSAAKYSGIADLDPLKYATNLTYLNLEDNYEYPQNFNSFTNINALAGMRSLKYLNLTREYGLRDVSALTSLRSLTDLELVYAPTLWQDISEFLPYLRNLTTLDVPGAYLSEPSYLAAMPALRELDMTGTGVDSAGLLVISQLPLTKLSIGGPYDGLPDLQPLAQMTTLESLRLETAQTTDPGMLAGLPHLTDLSFLRSGVTNVAPFKRLLHLQHLDLSYNAITDLRPLAGDKTLLTLTAANQSSYLIAPITVGVNVQYPQLNDITGAQPVGEIQDAGAKHPELWEWEDDRCLASPNPITGTVINFANCPNAVIGWDVEKTLPSGMTEDFEGQFS
jgi:Leucine-rich repeat (LRR) protein